MLPPRHSLPPPHCYYYYYYHHHCYYYYQYRYYVVKQFPHSGAVGKVWKFWWNVCGRWKLCGSCVDVGGRFPKVCGIVCVEACGKWKSVEKGGSTRGKRVEV